MFCFQSPLWTTQKPTSTTIGKQSLCVDARRDGRLFSLAKSRNQASLPIVMTTSLTNNNNSIAEVKHTSIANSESTIKVIKATIPVLKQHKIDIVSKFYSTLFARYPSLKRKFNMDRQKGGVVKENGIPAQLLALSNTILAYAEHIDDVEKLMPNMEGIFHKHISRGVTPIEYDYIGECLIFAIQCTLGNMATEEIITGWTEAYATLAKLFIEVETDLKGKLSEEAGYSDMVDMCVISNSYDENGKNHIIEFLPINNNIPPYEDGQFVSIDVSLNEGSHTMASLKLVNNDPNFLTVRFKDSKEKAASTLAKAKVNDVFKISIPCGKKHRVDKHNVGKTKISTAYSF